MIQEKHALMAKIRVIDRAVNAINEVEVIIEGSSLNVDLMINFYLGVRTYYWKRLCEIAVEENDKSRNEYDKLKRSEQ